MQMNTLSLKKLLCCCRERHEMEGNVPLDTVSQSDNPTTV